LSKFNQALLGKWLWWPASERDAIWHLEVEAKYSCLNGGWCTKEVEGPFGVGVRRHIRRGWGAFLKFIIFEVKDGYKIKFYLSLSSEYSMKRSTRTL
jgi:hypothetical protein